MALIFESKLDIKSMIKILRKKIKDIEWRMGDSDFLFMGFYVLGRTEEGIKIKIFEEDEPGKYFLGIYFYSTSLDQAQIQQANLVLKRRVMRAIGVKCHDIDNQV